MRRLVGVLAFLLCAMASVGASAQDILAHWVQMAPGGMAEARVVTQGASCPAALVGGVKVAMQVRAVPDKAFPVLLCTLSLTPGTAQTSVGGIDLQPPKASPQRILVLGDTGCRITGAIVQSCNDPSGWPFPQVAAQASRMKPDLVIHVGDYLYREAPCPAGDARCAGSPSGDNWPTWAADFFTPGKPLLEAAPWVIVRGNHEECYRAGTGFLRLLGPSPVVEGAPCAEHVPPYAVPIGAVDLVVMDNASAIDCCGGLMGALCIVHCLPPDALVDTYRDDFASLPKLVTKPSWLLMHHPIWGVVQADYGMTGGGNITLIDAEKETGIPDEVSLMLAGHIHTFEAINYRNNLPPQLIVGEGGDRLDRAPPDLSGRSIFTATIADGFSLPGYGFLLLTHQADDSWQVEVFDATGVRERVCTVAARRIDCSNN
jgi:hypothetical protein